MQNRLLKPVADSDRVFVFHDCCNVYLILMDERCLLIDLGSGAVLEHLDEIGVKKVDAVYFTHAHRDQCQGAEKATTAGIPMHFPQDARSFIQKEQRVDLNNIASFLRSYPGNFNIPRPFAGALFDVQPGGRITWGDLYMDVVSTPGHQSHQVAYIADIGDYHVAFCGDVMYSAGKVYEPFHLETDHYTGNGARLAMESLRALKQLRPDVICPSHGPVTWGDSWNAIETTVEKLRVLSELKDTNCPGRPAVKRLVPPIGNTLMKVFEHLYIWNNSYLLSSDDGAVLMVDNAGTLPEDFWRQYEKLIGQKPIEVILVSHIHCDHVEGIEPLRERQPLEVWAHESIAEAIEEPHRFRRPYLPARGTRVDRRLKTGERYQWHEYTFSAYEFPAQTDLHAAYEFTIDGHHLLFSGDNFYPMQQWGGTGGLSGFNGGHPMNGWRRSIELVLDLQPEWILASHIQPFLFRKEDFLAMLAWTEQVTQAMRDLAPDGNLERHHDPHFISLNPYTQQADSESLSITACVKNSYDRPVEVELRLVLPLHLQTDENIVTRTIEANKIEKIDWSIKVADGQDTRGIQMVTVDVVYDGQYLGEKAECYINLG